MPRPQPTSATSMPGLEPLLHAVERRDPLRHEVGAVRDAEEAGDAVEQVVVVLVPAEAVAAAEALEHRILRPDRGADGLEHAALVGRAVLVGEHGARPRAAA